MRPRVSSPGRLARAHISHCARGPALPHQEVRSDLEMSQQSAENAPATALADLFSPKPKALPTLIHTYMCVWDSYLNNALQVSLTLAILSTSALLCHLSLSIRSCQISLSLQFNLSHLPTTQPNYYQPCSHLSPSIQSRHKQGWRVSRSRQSCF